MSGNESCVYESIGLIRKFLDYKTIYPNNLIIEKPTSMKFLCENYHKWFPEHHSILFILNPNLQKDIDEFNIKPLLSKDYKQFLYVTNSIVDDTWKINGIWMFDYVIRQTRTTHTVIGFPSFSDDMCGQYAILVLRDYQPTLL